MPWKYPGCSFVWIFPVGRGNCAFIRTRLNHGFILDMAAGANGFEIGKFITKYFVPDLTSYPEKGTPKRIAQAVLSHPHTDHIARCGELKDGLLDPHLITCPNDRVDGERIDWTRLDNPAGGKAVVDQYRSLFAKRTPPLQTIEYEARSTSRELEYGVYYVRPPICAELHPNNNNHYTNSTSLVFWFRNGRDTILFPGDIMPDGMTHVLANQKGTEKRFTRFSPHTDGNQWHYATSNQPDLRALLAHYGLSVLVAPHHGLESCFSEELYKVIRGGKPRTVVISESEKLHDNFGSTHPIYQSDRGAELAKVQLDRAWEYHRSVTTKADHHILVIMNGDGNPAIYANNDPNYLLSVLK
jgi:hypothetical protein